MRNGIFKFVQINMKHLLYMTANLVNQANETKSLVLQYYGMQETTGTWSPLYSMYDFCKPRILSPLCSIMYDLCKPRILSDRPLYSLMYDLCKPRILSHLYSIMYDI